MSNGLEHLESDLERAEYLQNALVAEATDGSAVESQYRELRDLFLSDPHVKEFVPGFVRTNRGLREFWQFIKYKFSTYAERRDYIWGEFRPLLEKLDERRSDAPSVPAISSGLEAFDESGVHQVWQKALGRRVHDPEGAITAARTLLEAVCKHILDSRGVSYSADSIKLNQLYKLTATELSLAPNQHVEDVFKQILGGCSAVVNGLGTLRNRVGDAHGQGQRPVKPAARHAELAVNLSGSLSLFLVETFREMA